MGLKHGAIQGGFVARDSMGVYRYYPGEELPKPFPQWIVDFMDGVYGRKVFEDWWTVEDPSISIIVTIQGANFRWFFNNGVWEEDEWNGGSLQGPTHYNTGSLIIIVGDRSRDAVGDRWAAVGQAMRPFLMSKAKQAPPVVKVKAPQVYAWYQEGHCFKLEMGDVLRPVGDYNGYLGSCMDNPFNMDGYTKFPCPGGWDLYVDLSATPPVCACRYPNFSYVQKTADDLYEGKMPCVSLGGATPKSYEGLVRGIHGTTPGQYAVERIVKDLVYWNADGTECWYTNDKEWVKKDTPFPMPKDGDGVPWVATPEFTIALKGDVPVQINQLADSGQYTGYQLNQIKNPKPVSVSDSAEMIGDMIGDIAAMCENAGRYPVAWIQYPDGQIFCMDQGDLRPDAKIPDGPYIVISKHGYTIGVIGSPDLQSLMPYLQ